jgi:Allene oxide cyclase barrel like domain
MLARVWKVGVAAGVVALLLGGASFAAGSGAQGGRTIHLFDHTVRSTNVDVDGSKTFSVGDEFTFTDQLWTVDKSTRLGTLYGMCTVFDLTSTTSALHCQETARLSGGTIEAAGTIVSPNSQPNGPSRFSQAVLGGTGQFMAARGQVFVHSLSQNDSVVTIQLVG